MGRGGVAAGAARVDRAGGRAGFRKARCKLDSTELALDSPARGSHSGSSAPTQAPNLPT